VCEDLVQHQQAAEALLRVANLPQFAHTHSARHHCDYEQIKRDVLSWIVWGLIIMKCEASTLNAK